MRVAAGIALCLCLVAAGCGGGGGEKRLTAAEYRAKLTAIGKQEDAAQAAVGQGLRASTLAELTVHLEVYADTQDGVADQLTELKPPDDAKQANEELAAGLHAIAAATRDALPKVKAAKGPAAAVAVMEHSEAAAAAAQQLDHALNVLKKLGYTKGS